MNLYSNTLFIDLQNYRPLHAMWDSTIQQYKYHHLNLAHMQLH